MNTEHSQKKNDVNNALGNGERLRGKAVGPLPRVHLVPWSALGGDLVRPVTNIYVCSVYGTCLFLLDILSLLLNPLWSVCPESGHSLLLCSCSFPM